MSELESLLHRPRPSAWEIFLRNPCLFLAEKLYARHRRHLKTPPSLPSDAGAAADVVAQQPRRQMDGEEDEEEEDPLSVVCISDTHNNNARCDPLPPGNILIHAGDLTQSGSRAELQAAVDWLRAQPHRHKIVVAGNHDVFLDPQRSDKDGNDVSHLHKTNPCLSYLRRRKDEEERAKLIDWGDVKYLCDSGVWVTLNGRHGYVRLKVWGSPRSPRNGNWGFQYAREDAEKVWDRAVPDDVDILVTHGPPRAHLDAGGLGCDGLLREVWRVRPRLRLHVFGHVHAGHGHEWVQFDAVQRAYERTVSAPGGVWNLCKVVWAFGTASLLRCFSTSDEAKCQMVNAAMVGGLRDEVRHRPIKVYI